MHSLALTLWHAVEFSRYGCALTNEINFHLLGQPPNVLQQMHANNARVFTRVTLGILPFGLIRPRAARGVILGLTGQGVKSPMVTGPIDLPQILAIWPQPAKWPLNHAYLFAKGQLCHGENRL